jgi:hypothetical protein
VSKALSIVGSPTFTVLGSVDIVIEDLPAGSDFVLRSLQNNLFPVSSNTLVVRNCQGRVLLDDVRSGFSTRFEDSSQIFVSNSTLEHTTVIERSKASLAGSALTGADGSANGVEAARLIDSEVVVSRCEVTGGASLFAHPPNNTAVPGPAFTLSNSRLVLADDGTNPSSAGRFSSSPTPVPAIQGDGTLVLDPDVVLVSFQGAPLIQGSITTAVRNVPTVVAEGAPLGGTASVELQSDAGDTFFLILGSPGGPLPLPSLGGELWLTLSQSNVITAGVLDGTGRFSVDYLVPVYAPIAGLPRAWVGIAGDPTERFWLSNHAGISYGPQ